MRLFRVAGIQVSVDWSWLIALGYVMFVMVGDYQELLGPEQRDQAFAYGMIVAFAFFGSIVFHEFGHAIVARRNDIGILGIDLWLLGGLARMDREPPTPGVEFRVSAAGPFATVILAAGLLGAAYGVNDGPASHLEPFSIHAGESPLVVALTTLGWINVFLLVFNLIPAYPLDGGRIARSIIWKLTGDASRATIVSATIGKYFGYLLVAFGVFLAFGAQALFSGMLFMFMGWSLAQSAQAATSSEGIFSAARELTVADAMDRQPVVLPAEASAERALEEFFWRYRWPWFPVSDSQGRFLGLVEQNAVERIDESEREARRVEELILPGSDKDRAVLDDAPLTALLANQEIHDFGSLMAVDRQGSLTGVITMQQVQRALRDAIQRATEDLAPPQAP